MAIDVVSNANSNAREGALVSKIEDKDIFSLTL